MFITLNRRIVLIPRHQTQTSSYRITRRSVPRLKRLVRTHFARGAPRPHSVLIQILRRINKRVVQNVRTRNTRFRSIRVLFISTRPLLLRRSKTQQVRLSNSTRSRRRQQWRSRTTGQRSSHRRPLSTIAVREAFSPLFINISKAILMCRTLQRFSVRHTEFSKAPTSKM